MCQPRSNDKRSIQSKVKLRWSKILNHPRKNPFELNVICGAFWKVEYAVLFISVFSKIE